MKVIVAGSRDFTNEELVHHVLDCWKDKITEVVSGTAKGPDTFGANWAKKNNIPVKEFKPDWDTHGKAAGPLRNGDMAEYADHLFAFWENKSRGTYNMINHMKNLKKSWIVWENSNDTSVKDLIGSGHTFGLKEEKEIPRKPKTSFKKAPEKKPAQSSFNPFKDLLG